jgi:peptidoglycan/LPS O-acetylase OafA/YrhL
MVMSGFVLSMGALGRDVAWGSFIRNRFLRIYPLLLFVLLLGLVGNLGQYSFLAVLQTLLFQADMPGAASVGELSAMFWAVAVEFQFYLLFPFLHRFIEKEGGRWVLGLVVLICVTRALSVAAQRENTQDVCYWHLLGRLDQLVIGMFAARLYKRVEPIQRSGLWSIACVGALIATLCLLVVFNQLGGWPARAVWKAVWPSVEAAFWAAFVVTYTLAARNMPQSVSAPLAELGSWSYSIYLLHFFAIGFAARIFGYTLGARPNGQANKFVLTVVLPGLLPVAALSYYVVERPFLKLRGRYTREVSE